MGVRGINADAFRDFERRAHSRIADSYNDLFAAVTDRASTPLLDAVKAAPGKRLLDVAAGPGRLAATAAARGASVTGCDLSPAMVALARTLNPGVHFDEASAEALPYRDGAFDAVVCAFGMGHFSDAEGVAAEFARVLTRGGAVALSWWDNFAQNRINGLFHETIGELGLTAPAELPLGPPIDRFSDRETFGAFLRSAGFTEVTVAPVSFAHRLPDADALWQLAMGSFARASTMIAAQTEEMQRRIRLAVAEKAQAYAVPHGLAIPVAFLVASGIRR